VKIRFKKGEPTRELTRDEEYTFIMGYVYGMMIVFGLFIIFQYLGWF